MAREPIVATYSIAACDLDAKQWGVAVQSKFLVGRLGRAVGGAGGRRDRDAGVREPAVRAERSRASPRRAGAAEVVERLTAQDEGRAARQLGVVDGEGRSASWTGPECNEWAGHRNGPCYAAQGNILVGGETVDALAETFESNTQPPARAAPARLPRRSAGRGRRPSRPAVGVAPRRRARRRLRVAVRHPRRSPRRGSRAPHRGAAPHLRPPPPAVRGDAARRVAPARRRAPRRSGRAPSRARATTRSLAGPASRTSRSASTARTRSTRSYSMRYGR